MRLGGVAMEYVSTQGRAPTLGFEDVALAGLASDGGLYLPREWPVLSAETIAGLAGKSYVETAVTVMMPFVSDALGEDELRALCTEAYGRFSHAAVTPLVQLDHRHWLLELFHGPTLAFKDIALQLLGLLFERFLAKARHAPDGDRCHFGRYGVGGNRCLGGAGQGRRVHASPGGAGQRCAAAADDDRAVAEYPQHRDRGRF